LIITFDTPIKYYILHRNRMKHIDDNETIISNNTVQKKWQAPKMIKLNVKDTKGGFFTAETEGQFDFFFGS
ncbi:MAG: hypothetical protein KC427_09120, partial [Sulfurovum sp.]|uniref:hypothetical protein n=1 Tax=Sulfurovum sp. TaxID=1969726 RepID=UPI002868372F